MDGQMGGQADTEQSDGWTDTHKDRYPGGWTALIGRRIDRHRLLGKCIPRSISPGMREHHLHTHLRIKKFVFIMHFNNWHLLTQPGTNITVVRKRKKTTTTTTKVTQGILSDPYNRHLHENIDYSVHIRCAQTYCFQNKQETMSIITNTSYLTGLWYLAVLPRTMCNQKSVSTLFWHYTKFLNSVLLSHLGSHEWKRFANLNCIVTALVQVILVAF